MNHHIITINITSCADLEGVGGGGVEEGILKIQIYEFL